MKKLTDLQIAIIVSHSMRRFLKNFEPHERTKAVEKVMVRLHRFLFRAEKANLKDFVFATEYERILWQNTAYEYEKSTAISSVNFVNVLYDYFGSTICKSTDLTPKLMQKFSEVKDNDREYDSNDIYKFESNSNSITSTYIKLFEKDSGIGLKRSLFAGKKITIKNNLIIEGKKIAEGF